MPARNSVKNFIPQQYYHVYNRGVAKQPIFLDDADKQHFIDILSRHLDETNTELRYDNIPYAKFPDLELLCYCLMGNHFHMFFYIGDDENAIKELMQRATTAYSMYFNKRYKRVGPVFQGVYKAALITDDAYLLHISRYIHMNPRRYLRYRYSSITYYTSACRPPGYLKPQRLLELFEDNKAYIEFLQDYEDRKEVLDSVKADLAGY